MTYTFIELNGTIRQYKKPPSNLIESGKYTKVSKGKYRAIGSGEQRGLTVRYIAPWMAEIFDYDYPDQPLHPELAFIPAMRYPVQQAQRNLESF